MHRTTSGFWRHFDRLPEPLQAVARRSFHRLLLDSSHPSLRFKKVGRFWSVRVGAAYRALAVEDGDDFIWVWIGNHDDYDRMVSS